MLTTRQHQTGWLIVISVRAQVDVKPESIGKPWPLLGCCVRNETITINVLLFVYLITVTCSCCYRLTLSLVEDSWRTFRVHVLVRKLLWKILSHLVII